MSQNITETAEWLSSRMAFKPTTAVVLGTGLGRLAAEIEQVAAWPYKDIPGFPVSTVEGHAGRLVLGRLGQTPLLALDGRFHFYEGYSMKQVTFPVRVLAALGVNTLFVSNAAGATNPDYGVGDLMVITDHINLLPEHPLRGANEGTGPRFLDMSHAYDPALISLADRLAGHLRISLRHGVYLADQGPTYETPAEYRMCRLLGADAVGMSTVPEVIVARHCGMRVFGMSVITNASGPADAQPVSHAEVEQAAAAAGERMARLFRAMMNAAV